MRGDVLRSGDIESDISLERVPVHHGAHDGCARAAICESDQRQEVGSLGWGQNADPLPVYSYLDDLGGAPGSFFGDLMQGRGYRNPSGSRKEWTQHVEMLILLGCLHGCTGR